MSILEMSKLKHWEVNYKTIYSHREPFPGLKIHHHTFPLLLHVPPLFLLPFLFLLPSSSSFSPLLYPLPPFPPLLPLFSFSGPMLCPSILSGSALREAVLMSQWTF